MRETGSDLRRRWVKDANRAATSGGTTKSGSATMSSCRKPEAAWNRRRESSPAVSIPLAASRSAACFISERRVSDIRGFGGQEFRLMFRHQGQDQFLQSRAFHDLVQLI